MQIDCGACVLRPWRAGDERSLQRHADDREVSRNLRDRFPHPYTHADAVSWVALASSEKRRTHLAIDVGGEAVGGVAIDLHDDIERVAAEIGYWLGRAQWGRGVMSAAVHGATRYAFAEFGLTRVFAVPFAGNAASCRVLEKAGYTREGVMRRSAIKDGVVIDQVLYAITDHDQRPQPVPAP